MYFQKEHLSRKFLKWEPTLYANIFTLDGFLTFNILILVQKSAASTHANTVGYIHISIKDQTVRLCLGNQLVLLSGVI
jgi:hypothetical protein